MITKGFIGTEFVSNGDRGEFFVQLELPKDAAIEQTNALTLQAENYLRTKPEIVDLITTVGQASDGMVATQATPYKSEVDVQLVSKSDRKDASDIYAAKIRQELSRVLV